MGLLTSLPGLVNAHTHSPYGPQYAGITASQPFEAYIIDITVRQQAAYTLRELEAFALVTALDNLSAGNTAIVDQCYLPLTGEHVSAVAGAYRRLGLRAWIFTELSDLPFVIYTREAYPNYPKAIPLGDLPEELQALCAIEMDYRDQLQAVRTVIKGWQGGQVKIGIGLSNPVWCSDDLLRGAAELAAELDVPLAMHADESPMQRHVHQAQWNMSAIRRLEKLGCLSPRTLLAHVVQVDEDDIAVLAKHGCSVVHNPTSNLKLRNGVAPLGKMLNAGVNVCLGADGHSSGDSQSLFPVMKCVVALGWLNGLFDLMGSPEETALQMASANGRRLWFEEDLSDDRIAFTAPIGPYSHVWDDPTCKIEEVYINGIPRLERARQLVHQSGAEEIVAEHMRNMAAPQVVAQARAAAELVLRAYL